MTIKFCKITIKKTNQEIKEINSKVQLNILSTEYSNAKEQVNKNQEVTIQQRRIKKTCKYCQIKHGEQVPGKQTLNLSTKLNQPNHKENKLENNENNQYKTKRTYAASLRSNRPIE